MLTRLWVWLFGPGRDWPEINSIRIVLQNEKGGPGQWMDMPGLAVEHKGGFIWIRGTCGHYIGCFREKDVHSALPGGVPWPAA